MPESSFKVGKKYSAKPAAKTTAIDLEIALFKINNPEGTGDGVERGQQTDVGNGLTFQDMLT